jgi:cupin fold WbuC family metalloprotein
MRVFSGDFLNDLEIAAKQSPRKRAHYNLHHSYNEPCQRLFNALEFGTYIRPHRHWTDPKVELLVAVRGVLAFVAFNDHGHVKEITRFGSGVREEELAVGLEVTPEIWHTVIPLVPGCLLLEVKAGPFDPYQAKDLAPWAPNEGTPDADAYLRLLTELVTK